MAEYSELRKKNKGIFWLMDITALHYPKKSHRKRISFPEDSEELAELMGIITGDGGINNPWQVVISLSALVDTVYATYVTSLFLKLFAVSSVLRKRPNQNTLIVICSSVSLVDFLVFKGAVRGNKIKQQIGMPIWIKKTVAYQQAFLRGLFDTDGCTYIDHHRYNDNEYGYIGVAFTSYSPKLLHSVYMALRSMGYTQTLSTKRRVLLRRENEVMRFFQEIQPNNIRHHKVLRAFLEEYRSGYNGTVSKAVVAVK